MIPYHLHKYNLITGQYHILSEGDTVIIDKGSKVKIGPRSTIKDIIVRHGQGIETVEHSASSVNRFQSNVTIKYVNGAKVKHITPTLIESGKDFKQIKADQVVDYKPGYEATFGKGEEISYINQTTASYHEESKILIENYRINDLLKIPITFENDTYYM